MTVSSNNYKNANMVLDAFEQVYPDCASSSSGALEVQIVDKSQATEKPVNAYSLIKYLFLGLLPALTV